LEEPEDDDEDDDDTGGTTTVGTAVTTTTSGGGSPFTSTQQRALFQTTETFEVTIGSDQRFGITIENPVDGTLKGVKISVQGLLSKYLHLTTEEIGTLGQGESIKVYTEITSPEYFTPGKHTLTYTISGTIVDASGKETPFTETRTVTLLTHETSRLQALDYSEQIQRILLDMEAKGYKTSKISRWAQDIQVMLQNKEYDEIKKLTEQALAEQQNADEASTKISQLSAQLAEAETKQIPTPNTSRLLKLATLAFDRGDYAAALEKLKEAELTYAVETKGEFNVANFLMTHWAEIAQLAVVLFIVFYFFAKWIKWGLIKRKLQKQEMEEVLLLQLIKDSQKRCFVENQISMGEYYDALKQFEAKLAEIIENTIELQSAKSNLFRFKPAVVRLQQEKQELLNLIKETQSQYFQKGLIETRIYQTKMHSFTTRLARLEKDIVLKQATRAIRQQTGWKKPVWRLIYAIWR
jgi:hypothetical protein